MHHNLAFVKSQMFDYAFMAKYQWCSVLEVCYFYFLLCAFLEHILSLEYKNSDKNLKKKRRSPYRDTSSLPPHEL